MEVQTDMRYQLQVMRYHYYSPITKRIKEYDIQIHVMAI